jgi:hypothetical protein
MKNIETNPINKTVYVILEFNPKKEFVRFHDTMLFEDQVLAIAKALEMEGNSKENHKFWARSCIIV